MTRTEALRARTGAYAGLLAGRGLGAEGSEGLGRDAVEAPEFAAQMGTVHEAQFQDHGFAGPALGDELAGEATAQPADPLARGLVEVLQEESLHLPKGDGAEGGHDGGLENSFAGELFPVLDLEEATFSHEGDDG